MPMEERKVFWRLAGPAAAEGLLLMMLSAVDLLMVSSLGTTAVAAVSIFSQPRMVILCFSRAFAVAVTAYVARRSGESKGESFSRFTKQTLTIALVGGGILLFCTILLSKSILLFAGADLTYLDSAMAYARPAFFALFFSAPAIALHGVLAGLGDTKSVLKANVLGNIINVLCNAVFIYGIGPAPRLGVFGAGLGTLFGAVAALGYTLLILLPQKHPASLLKKSRWKPDRRYLSQIMPLYGGVFTEQAVERFGMFAYTRIVAGLGASSLGIHNICMGMCDIYYSFSQGMGKAGLIQCGNDIGATGGKKLKKICHVVKWESLLTASIACVLCIVLRVPVLSMYALEGQELLLASGIMLFVAFVSFPESFSLTHAGILRGMGHTGYVAIYSLVSIAILRPLITYLLVVVLDMQLYGAWTALLLDQSFRALFAVIGVCHMRKK